LLQSVTRGGGDIYQHYKHFQQVSKKMCYYSQHNMFIVNVTDKKFSAHPIYLFFSNFNYCQNMF